MRIVVITACVLLVPPALLNAATCKDPLSSNERRAVIDEDAKGDPVLAEAIALERAKYQRLSPAEDVASPTETAWEQARRLVLLGAVRVVAQHHDLSVFLFTKSRKAFTTREPRLDEIWKVVKEVDPCGVYVSRLTE
jgi:hypothetical protein